MTDPGGVGLYTWDSWLLGPEEGGAWVVHALTDGGPGLEERLAAGTHHEAARLSAWRTHDFHDFTLISDPVLSPRPDGWDSGGIWSGCVASVWLRDPEVEGLRGGRVLFYTSRDTRGGVSPRAAEQRIHCAVAPGDSVPGHELWRRVEGFSLGAEIGPWQRGTDPAEGTTGAWRDPHLFRIDRHLYMAVAAKAPQAPADRRGCVAILRCPGSDLTCWEPVGTVLPPAGMACEEMEVPHVGVDSAERVWLTYSTGGRGAPVPGGAPTGALHCLELIRRRGRLEIGEHRVLLDAESSLYAGWTAPNGDLVGFHKDRGGFFNLGPSPLPLTEDRDLLELSGLRPQWVLPMA